jgi:hypothetical protein
MKIFLHVLYTWVIAVFLLIIFMFADLWIEDSSKFASEVFFLGLAVTVFAGYLLCLPSLAIGFVLLKYLLKPELPSYIKFFLWYLSVIAAMVFDALFLAFIENSSNTALKILIEFWPAFPAALIAITVRYKQFLSLARQSLPADNLNTLEQLFKQDSTS